MTPQVVGRYQLLEPLGQGGMGTVYLAFDPALERQVALKLLNLPGGSERRRFRREVQVAARLNHRHIVTVHDVSLEHDPPFVVMELLTGGTLETYFKSHHLNWFEALNLLRPLCQALAHAHQAGIIHRDIKPANILFSGEPTPTLKLADFGLAQRQGSEQITEGGAVLGTLAYMSPEQATGQGSSAASDVFAVGIILFEAIAGFNPLRGENWSDTLLKVSSPDPLDLSALEGKAPPFVRAIISQAAAKDPRQRYRDGGQLEQAITQALSQTLPEDVLTLSPDLTPSSSELKIENAAAIPLPQDGSEILRRLFAGYGRITLKEELLGGRSGSRIFLVRPIRPDGTPELPAVVKMAPVHLIQQEWRAYQDYVRAQLAGIAEIQGQPVLPPGCTWGGLRYPLVGGGDFAITSLYHYCQETSLANLRYLLEQRLFRRMGEKWRHNFAMAEFRLGDSYDAILPVNLIIQPAPLSHDTTAPLLRPGSTGSFQTGQPLLVTEFVVTEVDEATQTVTLNRPSGGQPRFYPSYRLRLHPVTDVSQYQAGHTVDLEGIVTATRAELLVAQARAAAGEGVDLAAATLPNGWPNPLTQLPALLSETLNVRTANIHGDFNLDNILVDPATREVYLIDFALARRDHVLHDLLRLEKDVLTRLLPETLLAAALPPQSIALFYRWVDEALAQERPSALPAFPHPALEKPLYLVYLIRRAARDLLFDPRRWDEYEAGLTLYLLGALKFKDLTVQARGVAFWGAAALLQRRNEPIISQGASAELLLPAPSQATHRSFTRPLILVAGLLFVIMAFIIWRTGLQPEPPTPQIATILNFTEPVEVRRFEANQLQPVSFGLPLYDSDVVSTYEDGTATVYCENGLLFEIPGNSNRTVHCREQDGESVYIAPVPTDEPELDEATPVPPSTQNPFLLNPRNTAIISTRPTFTWEAMPQTTSYRLTVQFGNGDDWLRETSETTLLYPSDERALMPGEIHIITLEAIGAVTVTDVVEVRVLDGAAAASLMTSEANIRQEGLDAAAEMYLLAQLYARSGLTGAAITLLETLIGASGQGSPYVWQQLGDLYASIGLPRQAEASYEQVATAAAATPVSITPTPTVTPTPTPLPTNTAIPIPIPLVTLPVAPGTPVPQPGVAIAPRNVTQLIPLARWHGPALAEVACAPNGGGFAAAGTNGVTLYNPLTLGQEQFLPVGVYVNSVAFAPDGQFIATGATNSHIQLWQADGTFLDDAVEHSAGVWSLTFSRDGQWLASGALDNMVRLWRVEADHLVAESLLARHDAPVRSVAFSPDSQWLASASDDHTVQLRQVSDGTSVYTLPEQAAAVRTVAFSPDGAWLAAGLDDGSVQVWRMADGTLARTLPGDNWPVHSIAFSPDGQLLAVAGRNTNILLWQVSNWQLLQTLLEPTDWVYSVAFCADGYTLLSGSADGALYLWGVAP